MSHELNTSAVRQPELLGILNRQVAIYDQLRSLADKQRALITSEDTKPLLEVLARRQTLTEELSGLGRRMAPLRGNWPQVRQSLAPDERAAADDLISRANAQLEKILAGDEQDADMLRLRKQRVGAALETTQSNKRAVAAYRVGAQSATTRFDQTHDNS